MGEKSVPVVNEGLILSIDDLQKAASNKLPKTARGMHIYSFTLGIEDCAPKPSFCFENLQSNMKPPT